ncbi:hypothetical protein [Xenorhabdus szentirmaii]|uniref:hypothetical protein n=1 Tax=Xenorhabdus szentirmaii TaxID=290112 RepID=UPI0019A880A8|nr:MULTISPECIES: hypothetical protein [unclassified Xenorhabdus]MBD2790853.1 hypothetical protein [Xenorhabdus sp. CUL]MBD2826048.1 hypothetical protein [Xenorhabdus sp. 5]
MRYHYILFKLKDSYHGSVVRYDAYEDVWEKQKTVTEVETEKKNNPAGFLYKTDQSGPEKLYMVLREYRYFGATDIVLVDVSNGEYANTDFTSSSTIVPFNHSRNVNFLYQESSGTLNAAFLRFDNNNPLRLNLGGLSELNADLKQYEISGYPSMVHFDNHLGDNAKVFYVNADQKLASFDIDFHRQSTTGQRIYSKLTVIGSPSSIYNAWRGEHIVFYRSQYNELCYAIFSAHGPSAGRLLADGSLYSHRTGVFSSPTVIYSDKKATVYFVGDDEKMWMYQIDIAGKLPEIVLYRGNFVIGDVSGAPFAIASDTQVMF